MHFVTLSQTCYLQNLYYYRNPANLFVDMPKTDAVFEFIFKASEQ